VGGQLFWLQALSSGFGCCWVTIVLFSYTVLQLVIFPQFILQMFLRLRFLNGTLPTCGEFEVWCGKLPRTPTSILAPPAVQWLRHVLPLSFFVTIGPDLNAYVKGITGEWVAGDGNEKAGHLFQVLSRAGSWLGCGNIMLILGFRARWCRFFFLGLLFAHYLFSTLVSNS
jgi:hypothetical protein